MQTTKFTDRLQKTTKVRHRLQQLDLHSKVKVRVERSSKVSPTHPSHSGQVFDGEMAGVCTDILQTIFHFQFEELYMEESSRGQKVSKVHIFMILVYRCLSRPQKACSVPLFHYKVCSVPFLRLEKFLVSTFFILQCVLFSLQKFAVSAF